MSSSKIENVTRFKSITELLKKIKSELDGSKGNKTKKKVFMIFAGNSSGKTRLSKSFDNLYKGQVLYYNAFTEDLFTWDNENFALKFESDKWIFRTVDLQGLSDQITDNFQKFTGSTLEPKFNFQTGQVTFNLHSEDVDYSESIKISRGEERVFMWSIFYSILHAVIEFLNDTSDKNPIADFENFRYVVIDDPVSSMDDTRIITVALELLDLIKKSKNELRFLISTHHALFFNVLFNYRENKWDRKNYVLSKSGDELLLGIQGNDSPFAYHHTIISDIRNAIENNGLQKHHFNLFRALLEKTANFLGRSDGWKNLLPDEEYEVLIKTLNHYSHSRLSDLEPKDLSEHEKSDFIRAFQKFITKFDWGVAKNG